MAEKNYRIGIDYKLYVIEDDGTAVLEEETTKQEPFRYLSGFNTTLEKFETETVNLNVGDSFDFTLTKDEAYGDYYEDRVLMLDKQMFTVNGKFDSQNIQVDALVPLQNEAGQRFLGHVLEITETQVKMDLNHPLAGKTLNFKGTVVEKEEATAKEIQAMIAHLTGQGGGCGGCGGGNCGSCGGGNCGDGGCGGCN